MRSVGAALLWAAVPGLRPRAQELLTLRIALPPMIESFPITFAHDRGLFEEQGVQLEPVGYSNFFQLGQGLFSDRIHGALLDITSTLRLLVYGQIPMKITSTAYEAVDGRRRFALVTHHFSYISSLEGLFRRLDGGRDSIGMLRQTDMEFETDRLLAERGFQVNGELQYADFNELNQLATLLLAGSQLAGVLPEPAASYVEFFSEAQKIPVVVLADYRDHDLVPSVLAFRDELLGGEGTRGVEAFYRGFQGGLAQLKALPREQLVEVGVDSALRFFFPGLKREELPPEAEAFLQEYLIPAFPEPRALGAHEYESVSRWALEKEIIPTSVPFAQATTDLIVSHDRG